MFKLVGFKISKYAQNVVATGSTITLASLALAIAKANDVEFELIGFVKLKAVQSVSLNNGVASDGRNTLYYFAMVNEDTILNDDLVKEFKSSVADFLDVSGVVVELLVGPECIRTLLDVLRNSQERLFRVPAQYTLYVDEKVNVPERVHEMNLIADLAYNIPSLLSRQNAPVPQDIQESLDRDNQDGFFFWLCQTTHLDMHIHPNRRWLMRSTTLELATAIRVIGGILELEQSPRHFWSPGIESSWFAIRPRILALVHAPFSSSTTSSSPLM